MYDAPTDLKAVYSIRLLGAERTLRQMPRRYYDRSTTDEFINDASPVWYDMSRLSETGKLRLLPAPSETDRLLIRYYRRMSSASATCDIPADYDMYLIAWAKWAHPDRQGGVAGPRQCLAQSGDGRPEAHDRRHDAQAR